MNRRGFLKLSGLMTVQTLFASAALQSLWTVSAHGALVPLDGLHSALHPEDATILVPQSAQFTQYQAAFNKRTLKLPLVRVLCSTPAGVATAIKWAQANNVSIAMRSGGHSFEGLSQTTGLAIDTRPMGQMSLSSDKTSFITGAGCTLGPVYEALAAQNQVLPAGSCPTVGITGHALGGGYGFLARAFGLACDNLLAVELVNAEGDALNCSATENEDLFWALRGGGAGSFGVVTRLQFRTHQIETVFVYSIAWSVSGEVTKDLMRAWQEWASQAPREITSLMKVSKGASGLYNIRAIGQSIGSEEQLRAELARFTAISPSSVNIQNLPFMGAVHHFGGSFGLEPVYMKGKSDYLTQVMSDEGLSQFLLKLPLGIDVLFDSYGGAIGDVKSDETAFSHRAGFLSSLQYYTQWGDPSQGPAKLATMNAFYAAMRPYVSGSAYFNYCDLDIANWGTAYWGANLPKLIDVKEKYDPKNLFRHAQSVPLKG